MSRRIYGAAAAALVFALGLSGCGGQNNPDAATATTTQSSVPETFTATGVLELSDDYLYYKPDTPCAGHGGYRDIRRGAQVLIRDGSGETLALGQLAPGVATKYTCLFRFVIDDIPVQGDIYSVEVSHRGEISFTRDQASSVDLTLG